MATEDAEADSDPLCCCLSWGPVLEWRRNGPNLPALLPVDPCLLEPAVTVNADDSSALVSSVPILSVRAARFLALS